MRLIVLSHPIHLQSRWNLPQSLIAKSDQFLEHLKPLQGALESYARRMVRQPAAAEDVLQEAVLKAYRDFGRFAEGTNFRAWMFRYLNLEMLAANRRAKRDDHDLLPFEIAVRPPGDAFREFPTLELPLAEVQVLDNCDDELAAAIWDLSEMERSVLLLRAIPALTYREVAEVLQVPVGTVMSHLSRSRQRIRTQLQTWAATHNIGGKRGTDSA